MDWRNLLAVTDDANTGTSAFQFQQSSNSGSSFTTLLTIKDNGQVQANTFIGALSGNATTATTLKTARTINGTSFNGSANITTANWGTARTIKIGNTSKSVNGSANVTWTLSEIGAAASSHTHSYLPLAGGTMTGTIKSSLSTSTYLNGNNGNAVVNSTAAGSAYVTLLRKKSTNGVFTVNGYQGNFILGYTSDTTIEADNNTLDKALYFGESGNLYPSINNSQNLGDSSYKWANVYATTFTGALSGNASSATKLATARTIGVSGVTGTAQSFNGTKNIVIPITAVPASLLTGKSSIKGSEITNDKHWVPSSDNSVKNFMAMSATNFASNAGSLSTGTIVAITDGVEGYVTTQSTGLTCDLPLDL